MFSISHRHDVARRLITASIAAFSMAAATVGTPALAADKVSVGVLNAAGDIGLFIARERGYFTAEGIDADLAPLDSAVKMMPLLGSGDLDVGGGATSASLYNAADRKIDVRVVASRARTAPGYLYQGLVIRKDLVDSGRYKSFADLKGLKFGFASPGSTPLSSLNEAVKKGGLGMKDIELTYLNFPSQVLGLQNKAIDGTIMIEPYLNQVVASGAAALIAPTEDYYPAAEVSLLLYGDKFIKTRPDVARRFMRAFLRGARDFKDVIANGRWKTDGGADDVIRIFAKGVNMPEATIRAMTPQFADPDGAVNMASLATDLAYFKQAGDVTSQTITADMIVDLSFARKAATELGPYKAR
jgi:NitT/TauT family transport system substrate-binding protein